MPGTRSRATIGGMDDDERDGTLRRVVEVLAQAGPTDDLLHLHHLLAPEVVLRTCDGVVIGADAVVTAVRRWVGVHGAGWEVLDVVDGGDRMAIRFGRGGRQGALFLTAGDDGRLLAATVTPSAS